MDTDKLVSELLNELCEEIRQNPRIRKRLTQVVKKHLAEGDTPTKKSQRRKPGPFDPMAVHRDAPDELESRLDALEVEELKDIIAEHSMDRSKLAMKWKTKERLIELIISTVISRSQKGDAFRAQD